MFPFGRLARVLLRSLRAPRVAPLEEATIRFKVWPGDLDQNRHMNNGRYLTLMDLGRFDLMGRMGALGPIAKRRWYPVVGSATVRYFRSLDPFQTFELKTRILGWDDKAFFIEQRFERDGKTHAVGVIRGRFLGPEGKVPPAALVEILSPGTHSPPLPEWVQRWQDAMDLLGKN